VLPVTNGQGGFDSHTLPPNFFDSECFSPEKKPEKLLTRKVQLLSGICTEKALEQHLCRRLYYLNTMHIFILINQIIIQTQILLSRGFDGYMPDILLIQMHLPG
jgi:hypothetical protein